MGLGEEGHGGGVPLADMGLGVGAGPDLNLVYMVRLSSIPWSRGRWPSPALRFLRDVFPLRSC